MAALQCSGKRSIATMTLLMTVIRFLCFLSLISLLMVSDCLALYEDQVGLFDWRQQYIGNSKEVYFEQTSHSGTSKRVFLSTESNVLAALNARTGQIVWRQVFESNEGVINNLLHTSNILISVSGNGKTVRSWDTNKGYLIWETTSTNYARYEEDKYINLQNLLKNNQAVLLDKENGGLLVSTNKGVKLLSQSDGSEIWDYKVQDTSVRLFGVSRNGNKAIAFGVKEKNNRPFVNFIYLDLESGKVLNDKIVTAPWILHRDVSCVLISAKFFTCLSPEFRSVYVNNYVEDESNSIFLSTPLELLNVLNTETAKGGYVSLLSQSEDNDEFQIHVNRNHNILAQIQSQDGQVHFIKESRHPGFYTVAYLSNKKYIAEISREKNPTLKKEQLHVEIYDSSNLKSPIENLQMNMLYDKQYYQGDPMDCSLFIYSKKNDISYRLLLITDDHSVSLIQNIDRKDGKILWTRNEALASVSSVKMIELPPSTSASKLELLHSEFSMVPDSSVLIMFINRVKSQIRQFQAFTESLRKRQRYIDPTSDNSDSESVSVLKRDQFNIIKMILLMTEGRKMFAINSQNGDVVWSRFMHDIRKDTKSSVVIEQRTTAHFPLPPQCVMVAPYNENLMTDESTVGSKHTVIYSFNPLTGEGLEVPTRIESYKIIQVAELPFTDEKFLKVIGLVDSTYHFHIFPKSSDSLKKLKLHLHSIYIYIVNKTTNSFKGYKIKAVSSTFTLYEVWSVNIPSDQVILTIKKKRDDEVVNSVGRVLGDHTVLYKYLNPNLLAFMTMQGHGAKSGIFVYIIDAVTGHVVYQARHKGVEEPVDMILSEHWLVYLYYNTKGRRIEISVAEFYEGYEEQNHTGFSSLDPVGPPMVLSQGYLLPVSGVKAITSTATERGITNKNILLGLDTGFVYSIPKNFLDPRRSFKPTPMLQEEGVPPYMPELPVMAQGYINYNQTVQNIRGIYTSPAGLESTSLVLVYGLDLFYTRVTPSKMFDVLKEDFDYILISGVLSALILASIVCSKLASMKALKMAWT